MKLIELVLRLIQGVANLVKLVIILLTGFFPQEVDISKMEERNGIIYVIGEDKPFTGKFVEKYNNGLIEMETTYRNGIKHGKEKNYHPNGKIFKEQDWKNGNLTGETKNWDENGNIINK